MIVEFLIAISVVFCEDFQSLHSEELVVKEYQKEQIPNSEYIHKYKYQQSVNLSKSELSSSQINSPCQWNVSQTGGGQFSSISDALAQPCSDIDGYQITLFDNNHYEYVQINQISSIHIKGSNTHKCNWSFNSTCDAIIYLQQGNLKLENLNFEFWIINDKISPNVCLIYASSKQQSISITVKECSFYTAQHNSNDNDMYLISVRNASKFDIDSCIFNGAGLDKPSNISMIYISNCKTIIFNKCKFSNASISSRFDAIVIFASVQNSSVNIHDCSFLNINSNIPEAISTIYLQIFSQINTAIERNLFENCTGYQNSTGALHILDGYNGDNTGNNIIIHNNTFTNNSFSLTGGIFFQSLFQFSNPKVNNNTFSFNQNSEQQQLGCDAYLEYNSPSADWINVKEIEKSVLVMFEGSTTNAGNGSVSFFVYREEGNITGYVTLPEPVIPKSNKGVVVGIVIGILVLIAAIVTIGVIVFVVYRKQNQDKKGASSIEQSNPIIDETYLSA